MVNISNRRADSKTSMFVPGEYLAPLKQTLDFKNFYNNDESSIVFEIISKVIKNKKLDVISFDVFDTLLIRESKCELERFEEISSLFYSKISNTVRNVSATDLFLARVCAAKINYSCSNFIQGTGEASFIDIASTVCRMLNIESYTDTYIENEIAYEEKAVTLNPLVNRIMNEFPLCKYILTSDMYLNSRTIHSLVSKFIDPGKIGEVFSSADGFGSKRCGDLFNYVSKTINVVGTQILHIGDSFVSDFQMPRAHGWNSIYLPIPDYEKRIRTDGYKKIIKKEEIRYIKSLVNFNL